MNPYVASRLVDDRLAEDRSGLVRPAGGEGSAWRPGRASLRPHVDPAAWCLRAPALPVAGATPVAAARTAGAGAAAGHSAGAHPGRVRRIAGWLLVDAGLRLAVGRRHAALRG